MIPAEPVLLVTVFDGLCSLHHQHQTSMAKNLLGLPHEVLHSIIANADPQDLAALCCCCRALNDFIKDNNLLYKELYLKSFVQHHLMSCSINAETLPRIGSITA